MDPRFIRHAVVAVVAAAGALLATAPLEAQVLVPVGARRSAPPTAMRLATATAPIARAAAAAPRSTWEDVRIGIGIGGLAGMVVGGIIGSRSECGGDNSGVCPMLGALGGGTIGMATGVVVGGVAGYVWHRTRPPVR